MDSNSKTILIVEDDASLRKAIVEKLTIEGFHILEADDGKKGLESAFNNHPNLIVLDIMMPHMNGLEMMKLLRKKTGKKTPIIIFTNVEPNMAIIKQALDDEPSFFLRKYETPLATLVEKIREVLK